MSNPDTLLLYTDILEDIEDLPLDCLGRLFLALLKYQRSAAEPQLDPTTKMAFRFIRKAIIRNNNKYDAVKEQRKKAGSEGGKAKARNAKLRANQRQSDTNEEADLADVSEDVANLADASEDVADPAEASEDVADLVEASEDVADLAEASTANNLQAKLHIPVPETVPVPGPVRRPDPNPVPVPSSLLRKQKRDRSAEFLSLWDAYPRHQSLAEAKEVYLTLDLPPLAVLLEAIERLRGSAQWQQDNGKYVPSLAKWLRCGGWNDQLPAPNVGYQRHGDPISPSMLAAVKEMLADEDI